MVQWPTPWTGMMIRCTPPGPPGVTRSLDAYSVVCKSDDGDDGGVAQHTTDTVSLRGTVGSRMGPLGHAWDRWVTHGTVGSRMGPVNTLLRLSESPVDGGHHNSSFNRRRQSTSPGGDITYIYLLSALQFASPSPASYGLVVVPPLTGLSWRH